MDAGRLPGTLRLAKMESDMPSTIEIGQSWSTWVPARRQWLLATVIGRDNGEAILKFDARYGAGRGYDEQRADEITMLTASNLFRFVEAE
jgi:hypothetical protein